MGDREKAQINWNYWPDGNLNCNFSSDEFKATKNLMTHFATEVGGGDVRGKKDADQWKDGKRATRKCLGIIHCVNFPQCRFLLRPHTKSRARSKQLEGSCSAVGCGLKLKHLTCDVKSTLWTWSGGVYFSNKGYHNHQRPPHILHLSPDEQVPQGAHEMIYEKMIQ